MQSELRSILLRIKPLQPDCLAVGVTIRSGHFVSTSVLHDRPLQLAGSGEMLFSQAFSVVGWWLVGSRGKWEFELFSAEEQTSSRLFTSGELALRLLLLWDFLFCLTRGVSSLCFVVLLSATHAHPTRGNKDVGGEIPALWLLSGLESGWSAPSDKGD